MRWIVLSFVVAACGGPQIPTHNGYKPKERSPWKKAKALKFDDKNEAKTDGELSYPDMRRARWYLVDLPTSAELSLALEITPPGDAVNDDFDLAMEVLDPAYKVISKSDLEDEDAHELTKNKQLYDLTPGKYLVHLYLQGRLDTADYVLRASYKMTAAAEVKSNFPAEVPFVPSLPMVALNDDTPKNYKPPTIAVTHVVRQPHHPTPPPPTPVATVSARIIGMQVVSGGTMITIGRGKASGASDGMKAKIAGISGGFTIGNCNDRTCTATVSATPDQIKSATSVTLTP